MLSNILLTNTLSAFLWSFKNLNFANEDKQVGKKM